MGSLTLTISYAKNTGIVYSASELLQLFFFGTPPRDRSGNPLPEDTIEFYIESAQKELEDYLSIKLLRQHIQETRDFAYDDWINWGYMSTTYPVVTPKALKGYINTTLQITYPVTWLKSKSQRSDKDLYHRSISLVPVHSGSVSGNPSTPTILGITPLLGFFGNKTVPHYWSQEYITGWNIVPKDLLRIIGVMASLPIYVMIQDSVFGPGVQSKSIGADGLSQSVSSTQGGAYSARLKEYRAIINETLPRLKAKFTGIAFGVLG